MSKKLVLFVSLIMIFSLSFVFATEGNQDTLLISPAPNATEDTNSATSDIPVQNETSENTDVAAPTEGTTDVPSEGADVTTPNASENAPENTDVPTNGDEAETGSDDASANEDTTNKEEDTNASDDHVHEEASSKDSNIAGAVIAIVIVIAVVAIVAVLQKK